MKRRSFIRRFFTFVLTLVLIATVALPAMASEQSETIFTEDTLLENGLTVRDEIVVYQSSARSSTVTADRKKSVYDGDTLIAYIVFRVTYGYDGSSAWVLTKEVTQTDTYEGWSYKQQSFTASGSTVSLTGKLSKWLIFNSTFTATMTCDKDGNITAT